MMYARVKEASDDFLFGAAKSGRLFRMFTNLKGDKREYRIIDKIVPDEHECKQDPFCFCFTLSVARGAVANKRIYFLTGN